MSDIKSAKIDLKKIYLDPNNPRIGWGTETQRPGYSDHEALFSDENQKKTNEAMLNSDHRVEELAKTIVAKGWFPLDSIWVWCHPEVSDKYVVVEGNRRITTLNYIINSMKPKALKNEATAQRGNNVKKLQDAKAELDKINDVIANVEMLEVKLVVVEKPEELEHALTKLLSIRHINGAKEWIPLASDMWLYSQYKRIFELKHGEVPLVVDPEIIQELSGEASITPIIGKQKIRSVAMFDNFKTATENDLPLKDNKQPGEFRPSDYFLFVEAAKKPILRQFFGMKDDDLEMSEQSTKALFEWTFKLKRDEKDEHGDNNPNTFHAHRNITQLAQFMTTDANHQTAFATSYDIDSPDTAIKFREQRARFLAYTNKKARGEILDNLIKDLGAINNDDWLNRGEHIKIKLRELNSILQTILPIAEAVTNSDGDANG